MNMTRDQLLDLPQHLATLREPVFADELWLVPVKDETVVIAVNVNHNPSHVIAAYADRKSTRLNSSHIPLSRMPSSA